jgi:hypothetical protein
MNIQQQVLILSAELTKNSHETNCEVSMNLFNNLKDLGIKFKPAEGYYKGSREISFVTLPKNDTEIQVLKDFAFKNFDQESVLLQDANGVTELIYNDGKTERLGRLRQVNPKFLEGLDSYTVMGGNIYTTEEV